MSMQPEHRAQPGSQSGGWGSGQPTGQPTGQPAAPAEAFKGKDDVGGGVAVHAKKLAHGGIL